MPRVLMYHLFNPIHKSIFKSVLSWNLLLLFLTHKNNFGGAQKKLYLWHEIFHCAYSHWLDHKLSPGARTSYFLIKYDKPLLTDYWFFILGKLSSELIFINQHFLFRALLHSHRDDIHQNRQLVHGGVHKFSLQVELINKIISINIEHFRLCK